MASVAARLATAYLMARISHFVAPNLVNRHKDGIDDLSDGPLGSIDRNVRVRIDLPAFVKQLRDAALERQTSFHELGSRLACASDSRRYHVDACSQADGQSQGA